MANHYIPQHCLTSNKDLSDIRGSKNLNIISPERETF